MLGAMIGIKEGTHFEVDVWPELSRRANAMLKIVSNLFVLIFALVFVYWGIKFVRVRLGPGIRARRAADAVHLRRLAARRRDLDPLPGRGLRRQYPHPGRKAAA